MFLLVSAALLSFAGEPAPSAAVISRETGIYSYEFSWPSEARAIPALDRSLRKEAQAAAAELTADATKARAAATRDKGWYPDSGYDLSHGYELAGQSRRLLSLAGAIASYTGGAHGNIGSMALLWDRLRGRRIALRDLLRPGQSWDIAIRRPFCVLLDRERAEKRGEPIVRGEWPNQCPALTELTLVLADRDKDRRFDHLTVTADPYVAGAYAEGSYAIDLPLTAAMLSRLRPEFTSSFEAQPPVQ